MGSACQVQHGFIVGWIMRERLLHQRWEGTLVRSRGDQSTRGSGKSDLKPTSAKYGCPEPVLREKKAILSFCRDNCCLYMCSLLFPFVAIPIALWLLLLRETRISWDLSLSSHVDLGWWTPQDGNQKSCSNMKHYEADQNPRLSLIIFHPYLLYTYYIYI